MISPITSILSRISPKEKLNILTIHSHESFSTSLQDVPHNFYGLSGQGIKEWNYSLKPLPKNHFIIKKQFSPIPPGIDFDLCLSQDRFYSFQILAPIAQQLNIPHINILHHLPNLGVAPKPLAEIKSWRADKNVYVGYESRKAWESEDGQVVYYGIDHEVYNGWTGESPNGCCVVNEYQGRDVFCGWNIFQEVSKEIPMKLIGQNPGLSEPAKTTEELVKFLCSSRFFLNTSQYSNFPMALAEALTCGTPVITTSHYESKHIIKHEENGFIADTAEDIIKYAKALLNDKSLADKIGAAGRETALRLFNKDRFTKDWCDIIRDTYEKFR